MTMQPRTSDNSAKYHVAVHAEDRGMPEGLARVMDIMQSAIAPKSITPGNNQQASSPEISPDQSSAKNDAAKKGGK